MVVSRRTPGLRIGVLAGALAAASAMAMAPVSEPRLRAESPSINVPAGWKKKRKKQKGKAPNERSLRTARPESGSFKALRRWARANPRSIHVPTEKELLRHAWYRRKLAWDALRRAAA